MADSIGLPGRMLGCLPCTMQESVQKSYGAVDKAFLYALPLIVCNFFFFASKIQYILDFIYDCQIYMSYHKIEFLMKTYELFHHNFLFKRLSQVVVSLFFKVLTFLLFYLSKTIISMCLID